MLKRTLIGLAAVGMTLSLCAQVNRQTYRDSLGRTQGTATQDSRGRTTYRDALGRTQGTAQTDNYGKTTFRDAMGRVQATKK